MTRKSRRILIGLVVALTAVFAPAAGAQLPPVQVPPVQVPQTPAQTPQVQVPSVQVPQVQVPQVQTPQLQAPQVPGVNAPSVPGTGAPSSAGAPASSSSGLAADGSPIAGDGTFAPTSPGQAHATSTRAQRRQRAARTREAKLRDSARRLRGCLDALPGFDRRVIVLRAGIGGAPRTRRQVAEQLNVSVDRVRDAERSGVRGLRRADSDFGCGSTGGRVLGDTTGSTGTGGVGLAVSSVGLPEPAPATRLASNTSGASKDRNEVSGETKSSDDAGASSGAADPGKTVRQVAAADSGDSSFPQPLLLLALALIALMSAVALLRGRSTRAHATSGDGAEREVVPPAGAVAVGAVGEKAPWAAAVTEKPAAERQTAQPPTTDPVSAAAAQKIFAERAPEQRRPRAAEPTPVGAPERATDATWPRRATAPATEPTRARTVPAEPAAPPQETSEDDKTARSVAGAIGTGAGTVAVGFRDLGRDVVKRIRARRRRKS